MLCYFISLFFVLIHLIFLIYISNYLCWDFKRSIRRLITFETSRLFLKYFQCATFTKYMPTLRLNWLIQLHLTYLTQTFSPFRLLWFYFVVTFCILILHSSIYYLLLPLTLFHVPFLIQLKSRFIIPSIMNVDTCVSKRTVSMLVVIFAPLRVIVNTRCNFLSFGSNLRTS